jgi:hypothetical protein
MKLLWQLGNPLAEFLQLKKILGNFKNWEVWKFHETI